MSKYRFATTIGLSIALVVIMAIMAGGASVYSLHRVIKSKDAVVSVHFKNLLKIEEIRNAYGKKWSAARNYFMTGQDDFLENMQNSRAVLEALTSSLQNRLSSDEERELLSTFQQAEADQQETITEAVDWRENNQNTEAFNARFEDQLHTKADAVDEALGELVNTKSEALEAASAESSQAATTTLNLVALITGIAILLSVGMGVFVYRALRANERRRQAEDANTILRAVIEGTPDAIFVKDTLGRYLLINSAGAQLIGKPVAQILGNDDRALFPHDMAKEIVLSDRLIIESNTTTSAEEHWERNGIARTFHSLRAPYKGPDGATVGLIGISRDITERLMHEKMISEQQKLIAHSSKMRALGEMASGVAHEINNPLAIIRTKAEILRELSQDGESTPEVIQDTAERIEATVDRISKIINGLRTFARDSRDDPFTHCNFKTVIEETVEFCQERFKNHSITLIVPEIVNDLVIECRPTQISQVLLNLLNNAHDAVFEQSQKWVKLDVVERRDTVEFSVTDSGLGIPLEIQDKIMQPFFTTKQIGEGTGLGLSISKGLVESHHGQLRLDLKSKNTRFIVSLPKKQPAEVSKEKPVERKSA